MTWSYSTCGMKPLLKSMRIFIHKFTPNSYVTRVLVLQLFGSKLWTLEAKIYSTTGIELMVRT